MKATIKGKTFEVASQPADYWHWIAEGRYNSEFEVYDRYLTPEHTFVDLGAWVGGHTLYASTIAQTLVAVEPDPVAYKILQENVKRWPTLPLAISDKAGVVTLGSGFLGASTTRVNPAAGSGIGPWVEGQTCEDECATLRELLKKFADPLFIKIDIEGSEEAIFTDLELFKERKPTVLVELHPFWWKDVSKTWQDFEALKALYPNRKEICGNTWVLHD